MKKVISIILTVFAVSMLLVTPVLAYTYYATINLQETSGNTYTMYPARTPLDTTGLISGGYLTATGLDSRVTTGVNALPHMLADDKLLFASALPSLSAQPLYLYTGETALSAYNIITGYGGYFTITDAAALEPGDNFELEMEDSYLDTTAVPEIVYTGDYHTASYYHRIDLFEGIPAGNMIIVFISTDANPNITLPAGWTQLFLQANGVNNTLACYYRATDGTEGPEIYAILNASQELSYTSYMISGTTGNPEAGAAATGLNANPDPPNLAPSWGAVQSLWFVAEGNDGNQTVTAYPTGYTDGLNETGVHCGLGVATQVQTVASDNPGTFTISGADDWVANTVAIQIASADPFIKQDYVEILGKEDVLDIYLQTSGNIGAIMPDLVYPVVEAVNGGNDVVNQQNHTVNLPAGIVATELLIALFASDGNETITFPGGWTQLYQTNSAGQVTAGAWYRVADGTEGASITVTTTNNQMTAHTTFRISGYTGVPEVGVTATGNSNAPDPPSLTSSWGVDRTLWIAVSANDMDRAYNSYPNYYSNTRFDEAANVEGCGVASARIEKCTATENPGTFALNLADEWIANTIAIRSALFPVIAVATGEWNLKLKADGTNMELVADEGLPSEVSDTVPLTGMSVTDNASDWVLMRYYTAAYMDYYKHTVSGTLIGHYEPNTYIVGTTLPDRQGAAQDATITWGVNPTGVSIVMGGLVAYDAGVAGPGELEAPGVGGVINQPDDMFPSDSEMSGLGFFLEPAVSSIAGEINTPVQFIWWLMAAVVVLLAIVISYRYIPNMLMAGFAGAGAMGACVGMAFLPFWFIFVAAAAVIAVITMERSPSV